LIYAKQACRNRLPPHCRQRKRQTKSHLLAQVAFSKRKWSFTHYALADILFSGKGEKKWNQV
jgi:hypothetical protein